MIQELRDGITLTMQLADGSTAVFKPHNPEQKPPQAVNTQEPRDQEQMQPVPNDWLGPDSRLARQLEHSNTQTLAAYRAKASLAYEAANIERATAQGGYGRRQLYELAQNGADAIYEGHGGGDSRGGRISIVLADGTLYCANEGQAIDERGLVALLSSHISDKRGSEIGRFGLGFKSVLSVTDSPEFYSRTVSLRFNREWSHSRIKAEVPELAKNPDDRTPVLRLAEAVDPKAAASDDPILAELMEWATTVVRLPLSDASAQWLPADLESFPAEFLLFSPHVSEMRIEHRDTYFDRRITLEIDKEIRVLSDAGETTEWLVFEIPDYRPSDAGLEDAGELAHRESVPLIWAVPRKGTRDRGQFWAFFPTEYETTVKGILNAPWKTNEDRQNLLRGDFNDELISVFADLVVSNLEQLVNPEDPGAYLELLPGRGRETFQNWADEGLTNAIYARAHTVPSLPDQSGVLRLPSEMHIHPRPATSAAVQAWASHPGRPQDWCHPTVVGDTRRSRAVRLLEAVAGDMSVEGSAAAIRAADLLVDADRRTDHKVKSSYFILTSGGALATPNKTHVFFARDYVAESSELSYVHRDLVAEPVIRLALERMGIREADEVGEFRSILSQGVFQDTDWHGFWRLAGSLDPREAADAIRQSRTKLRSIRVMTLGGEFRRVSEVWLPGEVVSSDAGRDIDYTIDIDYHAVHRLLFEALDIGTGPTVAGGDEAEEWFSEYRAEIVQQYLAQIPRRNPRPTSLVFRERYFVGPLESLELLSDEGRAKLTMAALEIIPQEPWHMRHTSAGYPEMECLRPDLWKLRRHGMVPTSQGAKPLLDAVDAELAEWRLFLPVLEGNDQIGPLVDLPTSLADLTDDQWSQALKIAQSETDPDATFAFYAAASEYIPAPDKILAWKGTSTRLTAPNAVTVVTRPRELVALQSEQVPAILVGSEEEARRLIRTWDLSAPGGQVSTEVLQVPAALAEPITDRYPDLALILSPEQAEYLVQPCETIELFTLTAKGRSPAENLPEYHDEAKKLLLYQRDFDDRQLLDFISRTFQLHLDREEIEGIVENRRSAEAFEQIREIAQIDDPADRLLALAGPDSIRRRLPRTLVETVSTNDGLDDSRAARLFLASYGVEALKVLQDDIRGNGYPAPATWAGSSAAQEFVESLGFPEEYAGHQQRRRQPLLTVHGPIAIPPMHDFQREIADATRRLLRVQDGNRALLSLPTGAGKTRIAVESIIEGMRAGNIDGPVLWVAQTDELCEQAVQTWAYLWRAVGTEEELHISRLWSQNEARLVDEGRQVVVATIAKLDAIFGKASYDWLEGAACVVIDEAHAATTPSYTRLLQRTGIQRNRRVAPLLGLTATPFRGTSETETKRLVGRFGGWRLDDGVFGDSDPYVALQEIGVLAKVDHELLEGSTITLTDKELDELRRTRRLPSQIGERVGADRSRNETILNSISALPDDWPVLLFASSVDHAQTLAALLRERGISSASISATTDTGARRHYVEAFRRGEIRVLTNYNVLTQGFDAPATRAVYVTRPTFSPNVYQQMIGRGLRGPLNGGKDVCLIVNVEDNVQKFGEQLAFTEFEYLWNQDR